MIRLAIAGVCGRMGRTVAELTVRDSRFEIVAGLTIPGDPLVGKALQVADREVQVLLEPPAAVGYGELALRPCDVLIDFTVADGTMRWLDYCERRQIPMVIGATGHADKQLERIREAAHQIPIVKATNFSPGIHAILNAVAQLVRDMGPEYDIEIVETHHRHKVDAPSGTAHTILEAIQQARRDGGPVVFGRHGRTGERKPGEIGVHAVRMGEHVGQHEIHVSGPGETITLRHTAHSRETFAAGALRAAAWLVSKPAGFYTMRDVLRQ